MQQALGRRERNGGCVQEPARELSHCGQTIDTNTVSCGTGITYVSTDDYYPQSYLYPAVKPEDGFCYDDT